MPQFSKENAKAGAICLFASAFTLLFNSNAIAQDLPAEGLKQIDEALSGKQGSFDLSKRLFENKNALPIPIVVTDPAIGIGGGLIGVWFHEPPQSISKRSNSEESKTQLLPPSVTGVGGLATSNDSWAAFAGHFHSWNEDSIRYTGVIGMVDLNLKYHLPNRPLLGPEPFFEYTLSGALTSHKFEKRVSSKWALGLSYTYLASQASFHLPGAIRPATAPEDIDDFNLAGATFAATYDTRDNIISPSSGVLFKLAPQFFSEELGSDQTFSRIDFGYVGYYDFESLVLGLRIQGSLSETDAPFFMQPYVKQRGVPSLRFQGTEALSAEFEASFPLDERWRANVFAGRGWTHSQRVNQPISESVNAGGFGFRYLLSEKLGLLAGLDFGFSDVDSAVYITIGNPWRL